MTPLDAVLDRLDGVKRTRRGWSARCPVSTHHDHTPSLSIATGSRGRVLLFCFGGCSFDDVATALGMERGERTTTETPSTLDLALAIARHQPWYREETRLTYRIADGIRHYRQRADRLRRAVSIAGDTDTAWLAAARAADLDRDAERFEAMFEEIMR